MQHFRLDRYGFQCHGCIGEAFLAGRIQVLLLFGTNFISSFADANALAAGLARVGLVVSHDLFMNDTVRRFADIVLPGTAWLEELGCKMTNTICTSWSKPSRLQVQHVR